MGVRGIVVTFVVFVTGLLHGFQSVAQIKITFPVNRLVVQRNNNDQADVQIAGSYSQPLDAIEARVVARADNQGTNTSWAPLPTNPTNGQFNGTITVQKGWYKVLVRGLRGGTVVGTDSVDRFGVGEVFAIMGHSNAQGSACTVNGSNQCPTLDGSTDDRVNVVPIDMNGAIIQQQYLNTADTRYLPGMAFSQLALNSGISPFASMPWFWGHMGDVLVQRLNMPVLFYNAGFGGTSMQQTYWAAYDIPFQHFFVRYDLRMPYANFRNLMNLYVPSTGIRAFLIQHGENDRDNPTDSTAKYYRKVIDKIRSEFNKPNLACIIALSSFVGNRFDNVRSAQFQIIGTPDYSAFQGPDLDNINSQADRPDGIHFSPSGQTKVGELWANSISDAYLSTISPYPAETQPLASIACATANQLTLTQPGGYQYIWNTGSTANSVTVGEGTYSARLITGQNKVYFPPAIVVPTNVQPSTPTVTTDNGTLSICSTNGLRLTSSYGALNQWSTGASSASIVVTTPGVYSVQAKNPVYNCLSNPLSQTISLAPVDLAVQMRTSRRVVALNDTVSFWINVQNKSDCDAGTFSVQSRLPPNIMFVSSSDNLNAVNNIVNGSIGNIAAGVLASRRYIVRLTAEGMYIATAELTNTTNPLQNATPNNGTANGESDESQIDLRTPGATSSIYVSPNPNQGPLPPVQSNQPNPTIGKADLSLKMSASSLAPALNDLVRFTLIITNAGAATAQTAVVTVIIPAGLTLVNPSGWQINGSQMSMTQTNLTAGENRTITFMTRAVATGVIVTPAEISSAIPTDPDSTPGNGTTNGEDDTARIQLRVR